MILYTNLQENINNKKIFIKESQLKRINEAITDITYHFCGVNACYYILKSGKLALTMSTNSADAYDNKKLFYLSTQRSKSTKFGYAYSKSRNGASWSITRITIDGYEIKKDGYKGMPLDYWGASMGKQTEIGPTASRTKDYPYSPQDLLDRQKHNTSFEIEDRIISDKPYINNIDKYIKRIDILLGTDDQNYAYVKEALKLSVNYQFDVFVYDNPNEFEKQSNNVVNEKILALDDNIDTERENRWKRGDYINSNLITKLLMLLVYPSFDNYRFDEEKKELFLQYMSKFNLQDYAEKVFTRVKEDYTWGVNLQEISSNLGNSELRRLNTDNSVTSDDDENILLLAQFTLNKYNANSFASLARKIYKGEVGNNAKNNEKPIQESVKCVAIIYNNEDIDDVDSIVDGETELFWKHVDYYNLRMDLSKMIDTIDYYNDNGYGSDEDYSANGFSPFKHKSKDNESFFKYLEHMKYNENLSLYDGVKMLCNLFGNDFKIIKENMFYMFSCMFYPVVLTKNNFKLHENKINWRNKTEIIEKLWGSEDNYWKELAIRQS